MGKKKEGVSVNLDSFLDILTCLQGVLMLVIITTGIDAAQTKVLMPTPIERFSDKKPVYIECRSDYVYPIDVDGLWKKTKETLSAMAKKAKGDQLKMLQYMSSDEARVTNEYYEVDMSYALLGQLALKPNTNSGAAGFTLKENDTLATDNFIKTVTSSMDKEKDKLKMIVRDDSFKSFKITQRLAYLANVELSVEVFDSREPIRFSQMTAFK